MMAKSIFLNLVIKNTFDESTIKSFNEDGGDKMSSSDVNSAK